MLLGAFGSIFNTYAGLYLPKDNDLLLSMPVPVSSLVAARLSGVYLMGLMYSAVVILPAVIIYWVTVGVTASAVLGGLVLTLLISLAVLVLSCALGWVAAKISQKLRNKSLVVVLASLVFIGLYYFVYFKAQSVLQDLLANAGTYGAQIRSRAYPLYLFGSVGTGSGAAMLAVTAAVAALCGLMWVLLSRSFLHIATSTGKTARRTYRESCPAPPQRGRGAAAPGAGAFCRQPRLYAQLRPGDLPDAHLRRRRAVEGRQPLCHAGRPVCGYRGQRPGDAVRAAVRGAAPWLQEKGQRRCLPPCDGGRFPACFSGGIAIIPLTNTC